MITLASRKFPQHPALAKVVEISAASGAHILRLTWSNNSGYMETFATRDELWNVVAATGVGMTRKEVQRQAQVWQEMANPVRYSMMAPEDIAYAQERAAMYSKLQLDLA